MGFYEEGEGLDVVRIEFSPVRDAGQFPVESARRVDGREYARNALGGMARLAQKALEVGRSALRLVFDAISEKLRPYWEAIQEARAAWAVDSSVLAQSERFVEHVSRPAGKDVWLWRFTIVVAAVFLLRSFWPSDFGGVNIHVGDVNHVESTYYFQDFDTWEARSCVP